MKGRVIFEGFKPSRDIFGINGKSIPEATALIESGINNSSRLHFCCKIFGAHFDIQSVLNCESVEVSTVFLRRELKNSYRSYCESLKTGNWGITPQDKAKRFETGELTESRRYNESFESYERRHLAWFERAERMVADRGLEISRIEFSDMIKPDFDLAAALTPQA